MPETSNRPDVLRRMEKAEKLLQKGKTPDALAEYLQILEDDPANDNVRQIAADLCLSVNKKTLAVQLLGQLFDRRVGAADLIGASLIYKKLTRYATPTWEQKVRFGQLLEGSNNKLAVETYESALQDLQGQNKKEETLLVLRRIVGLEPIEANYMRLAELAAHLGEHAIAAEAFLRLAELAEAAGTDANKYFEHAYEENSSDMRIATGYGKSLLTRGDTGAAIFIFQPLVQAGDAPTELLDLYALALLTAERCVEAEPIVWQIFERNSSRIHQIVNLIGKMIDCGLDIEAVTLARKLEAYQRRRGEKRSFITIMQEILASHRPTVEMLEFLAELFNASNREADYAKALLKLFDLYCAKQNYIKAGDCLERAVEVDPYERGHQTRLEALRGRIDEHRFRAIADRFPNAKKEDAAAKKTTEPLSPGATLQDLMLQAEILVQYGMRTRAIELLHRIQQLFPQEEEHNPDLQRLFFAAGIQSRQANPSPPQAASEGKFEERADSAARGPSSTHSAYVSFSAAQSSSSPMPEVRRATETKGASSFALLAEITRKLYQQTNAEAVLKTATIEIIGAWHVARCIAALSKPGLSPTSMQQQCRTDLSPIRPADLAKLVSTLQDLAVTRGTVAIPDAQHAAELARIQSTIKELKIGSLLAVPLAENNGQEQAGVLILAEDKPRDWQSSEVLEVGTLSDHVVIALNNAGLRRLVKNLSLTDEKSGLLNRSSYLDFLQAEVRRGLQHQTSLTVVLMQFGRAGALVKEFGAAVVEQTMDQIGHVLSTNVRANDLAFRYESTAVALVLGDTSEKEALLALEKLRKLLKDIHAPGKEQPLEPCAGLAQALMSPQYDPVDIVTEVVNRADHALELAIAEGPGKVVCQAPKVAAAAVA